jgi:serine/threonine protein kinase
LAEIFRPFLENREPLGDDEKRLLRSFQRIKTTAPVIRLSADPAWASDEIRSSGSSVVRMALDSESNPIAVKRAKNPECAALIHREADILTALKHPLVLGLRAHIPVRTPSIITEFAGNGSLASRLTVGGQRPLPGPNRIAKVIAGIALAMRFAHSHGTIHRDLSPENILLDWDWTVRIADFGDSASLHAPPLVRRDAPSHWPSVDFRYLAPECYDGTFCSASDVFAFGLILFEILSGRPAFPDYLNRWQIEFMVAVEDARSEIPEVVVAPARVLIEDCWAADDRPTFEEIADRLAEMQFKMTAHVNSAKVAEFVKRVEDWEKQNATE